MSLNQEILILFNELVVENIPIIYVVLDLIFKSIRMALPLLFPLNDVDSSLYPHYRMLSF